MKVIYHGDGTTKDLPVTSIINFEVLNTISERGQLEDLQAQINLLTNIVATMTAYLPPEFAKDLVRTHCVLHKLKE